MLYIKESWKILGPAFCNIKRPVPSRRLSIEVGVQRKGLTDPTSTPAESTYQILEAFVPKFVEGMGAEARNQKHWVSEPFGQ